MGGISAGITNSALFLSALVATLYLCAATDDAATIMGRDNSQLTCMVPGPEGGSVPEDRRRLGFQPGPSGTVWPPVESGFDRPRVESLDSEALLQFLVDDVGQNELLFTSTTLPNDIPPVAAEFIPVVGSGGRLENIFSPDPDPLPPPGFIDPDQLGPIISFINSFGLGRCLLSAEWIELPDTFFPRFYSGSKCTNMADMPSCSFPEGLQCEPDISSPDRIAYITLLRWDCCWSYISRQWKWQCGWRRVEIPIIVDCICACTASLS